MIGELVSKELLGYKVKEIIKGFDHLKVLTYSDMVLIGRACFLSYRSRMTCLSGIWVVHSLSRGAAGRLRMSENNQTT